MEKKKKNQEHDGLIEHVAAKILRWDKTGLVELSELSDLTVQGGRHAKAYAGKRDSARIMAVRTITGEDNVDWNKKFAKKKEEIRRIKKKIRRVIRRRKR